MLEPSNMEANIQFLRNELIPKVQEQNTKEKKSIQTIADKISELDVTKSSVSVFYHQSNLY